MKNKILREFIEIGDLEDMVDTTIGIDMYDSKIGTQDEVIVVDFIVKSEAAGKDIVSFMNSSPIDMIDAEVSPAPGPDGKYRVFFEFNRNIDFPKSLISLLTDIVRLTGKLEWKVKNYYENGDEVPFTLDTFRSVPLGTEEVDTDEIE